MLVKSRVKPPPSSANVYTHSGANTDANAALYMLNTFGDNNNFFVEFISDFLHFIL
jgi:hypothetical protein